MVSLTWERPLQHTSFTGAAASGSIGQDTAGCSATCPGQAKCSWPQCSDSFHIGPYCLLVVLPMVILVKIPTAAVPLVLIEQGSVNLGSIVVTVAFRVATAGTAGGDACQDIVCLVPSVMTKQGSTNPGLRITGMTGR